MSKTYELTILNQRFTFKSDNDEKQVKKVADYVNKKMHDIVAKNKAISTANVAILAALNIADDFVQYQFTQKEQIGKWASRLKEVSQSKLIQKEQK